MRLVDSDGQALGIMNTRDALRMAEDRGVDLVEIASQASPPVCKLLDYGKFRYEQQKKQKEARKNQKIVQIKELKLRLNTDVHDYDVKLKNAKKFLENGDKVKFTIRLRGREITHQDIAKEKLTQIMNDLDDLCKIETAPKMEGRQAVLMVSPLK